MSDQQSYTELLGTFDPDSFRNDPETFIQRYVSWSELNQDDVTRQLARDPSLFRVLLPPHHRSVRIAANLAWYLDEVLLRDQLHALLVDVGRDDRLLPQVEPMVARMQEIASWIDDRYCLLYSVPFGTKTSEDVAARVLDRAEVSEALTNSARYGFDRRSNQEGTTFDAYDVTLLYMGRMLGWGGGPAIPPGEGVALPLVDFNELYPQVTRAEFYEHAKGDVAKDHFRHEVEVVLNVASAAAAARVAGVFDREVDIHIVNGAGYELNTDAQRAVVEVMNVTLPYLDGVAPADLMRLRQSIPTAFFDFRSRLRDCVDNAHSTDDENPAVVRDRISLVLNSALQGLSAEVSAAAKSARIVGYSGAVAAAAGVLSGTIVGIVPAMLAGLVPSAAAAAKYAASATKAEAKPFYFLWKAQQLKR